jgi:hypothetical protein
MSGKQLFFTFFRKIVRALRVIGRSSAFCACAGLQKQARNRTRKQDKRKKQNLMETKIKCKTESKLAL